MGESRSGRILSLGAGLALVFGLGGCRQREADNLERPSRKDNPGQLGAGRNPGVMGQQGQQGYPTLSPEVRSLDSDRVPTPIKVPEITGTALEPVALEGVRGWVTRIPGAAILPSVAYGDGRVYVSGGFQSTSVFALASSSGKLSWRRDQLEDNGPTAAIFDEGRLVFNTESCTLFNLEASTGKKVWHKWLGDPTLTQPAVVRDKVLASHPTRGATAWALSAYKLSSGGQLWTADLDGELLSAPVISGDAAYVATVAGTLYRFSVSSGARAWSRAMAASTAPWLEGDALYVGRRVKDDSERMVMVDAKTGEILREEATRKGYLGDLPRDLHDWEQVWRYEGSRPLVIDGTRYVAMGDLLSATDAKTGAPRWERQYFWNDGPAKADTVGKRALASVAYANGQLVVASRGGEVYGVDAASGRTRWAYALGAPLQSQPIVAHGWVYLTTSDGRVIGLEAGDASLDGWHMWGGGPGHNGPNPLAGAL